MNKKPLPFERWQDDKGKLYWPMNITFLNLKVKIVAKYFIYPKDGIKYSDLNRIN